MFRDGTCCGSWIEIFALVRPTDSQKYAGVYAYVTAWPPLATDTTRPQAAGRRPKPPVHTSVHIHCRNNIRIYFPHSAKLGQSTPCSSPNRIARQFTPDLASSNFVCSPLSPTMPVLISKVSASCHLVRGKGNLRARIVPQAMLDRPEREGMRDTKAFVSARIGSTQKAGDGYLWRIVVDLFQPQSVDSDLEEEYGPYVDEMKVPQKRSKGMYSSHLFEKKAVEGSDDEH
eukprot:gene10575-12234_t